MKRVSKSITTGRLLAGIFFLILCPLLMACEDLIDMELLDAGPRLVIVGEISNRDRIHEVRVHQTVPVSSSSMLDPVSGVAVRVTDRSGRTFVFNETAPGVYRSRQFRGLIGMEYTLEVEVDGKMYQASSTIPFVVPVDSIGIASSDFMGQENRFVTLKFQDPPGISNYYRYTLSVNGGENRFAAVFDDKFNDGRFVTHELLNFDIKLAAGDEVKVHRQFIDQAVYQYWQSVSSANPAASAPANPPSNISNGALGYFSAYSLMEFNVYIAQ